MTFRNYINNDNDNKKRIYKAILYFYNHGKSFAKKKYIYCNKHELLLDDS